MGHDDPAAVVLSFVKAFSAEDLETLASVLHPDVVIHASRGPRRGIEEALGWARRAETGELEQRVELEHIDVGESEEAAVALVRRQWWWRDEGELAREDRMAWLFELRDGLVASWRPFEDRDEALATLGP
jgi:ketosteroid isomerase-like protein